MVVLGIEKNKIIIESEVGSRVFWLFWCRNVVNNSMLKWFGGIIIAVVDKLFCYVRGKK